MIGMTDASSDIEGQGRVASIGIHPVKSLRGLEPRAWPFERLGPWLDRRWMLIEGATGPGRFLSLRKDPDLARCRIELSPASPAPEAALPLRVAPGVVGVGTLGVALVGEGVGGRADADHRAARLDVVDDVLHVLVGELPEPQEEDQHVRRVDGGQPRDVGLVVRVDDAGLWVLGEEHRAAETVTLRQDLRQHRQCLLGAVLLVTGNEDEVLAAALAFCCTFDQTGQVEDLDFRATVLHHAGNARQRGEGVRARLRMSVGDLRNEGRLSNGGESDEGDRGITRFPDFEAFAWT